MFMMVFLSPAGAQACLLCYLQRCLLPVLSQDQMLATTVATVCGLQPLSPPISQTSPIPTSTSLPIFSLHLIIGNKLMCWSWRIRVSFCPLAFLSYVLCLWVCACFNSNSVANAIPKDQSIAYRQLWHIGRWLAETLDDDILLSVPIKRLAWHPQMSKS